MERAAAIRPAPARVIPLWAVGAAFWIAVGVVIAARAAGIAESETLATFGVIFTSIVVEALPFILLGAAASAAIAVWVPARAFARVARLPAPLQVPAAAAAGLAMPVCECGSVPVARRLMLRGLSPAAGIAFMLAAPILNPIVLASTWVAYGAAGKAVEMTAARAGLGLIVAVLAGWLIGRGRGELLREREEPVDHHQHTGGFAEHLADDFVFMGRFVVLGAAVAALLQTVVPQDALSAVADRPLLGALALMGLAVALSLCSEADAFVAVSFTAFPLGSQLAFLVLGPVVDAKLAVLYGATFRRGFVLQVLVIAVPVALAGALVFDEVFG
ncbi:MAG: permease [Thermoleophilaceae bacterium]